MKLSTIIIVSGLAFTWNAQAVAADGSTKSRGKPQGTVTKQQTPRIETYRSRDAGCGWRDNAAPIRSLNDPCEQEEFWRRLQDKGREDPRPERN